jgi:hypothetical protein
MISHDLARLLASIRSYAVGVFFRLTCPYRAGSTVYLTERFWTDRDQAVEAIEALVDVNPYEQLDMLMKWYGTKNLQRVGLRGTVRLIEMDSQHKYALLVKFGNVHILVYQPKIHLIPSDDITELLYE